MIVTKGYISQKVLDAFTRHKHWVIGIADGDTEVETEDMIPILQLIGEDISCKIPISRPPKNGWTISKLTDHVYRCVNKDAGESVT